MDPKDMTTVDLLREFIYVSNARRTFDHPDLPLSAAGLPADRIAAIEAEINRRFPA